MNLNQDQMVTLIVLIALWTIPWKGMALWKAARRGEKAWFVALLVLNTLAILEIIYLFVFAREKEELMVAPNNNIQKV